MLFDNTRTDDLEKPLLFKDKGNRFHEIYQVEYNFNTYDLAFYPRWFFINDFEDHSELYHDGDNSIGEIDELNEEFKSMNALVSRSYALLLKDLFQRLDDNYECFFENNVMIKHGIGISKLNAIEITDKYIICMIE